MSLSKRHIRFISKALLLVGYLFLFSSQTNYRFYCVANFFDYHRASHMVPARGSADLCNYAPGSNKIHLGVDKRYSAKHFIQLPFTAFTPIPSYEGIVRIYYVPLKVYASSDLFPNNALRGPPCA